MYGLKMFKTWVEMSEQVRVKRLDIMGCNVIEVSSFEIKG